MALRLQAEFRTWAEFFSAVKQYCDETFQPFVKSSSKKVSTHNKTVQNHYPEEMEHYYHSYTCTHHGEFTSGGTGQRQTKSNKAGCKAKIRACLDKHDKHKIVVTYLCDIHNHDIGPHLYSRYAKNRCLKNDEREQAEKLCALDIPAKTLRDELKKMTGKNVTLQDVHNIRKRIKQKNHSDEAGLSQGGAQKVNREAELEESARKEFAENLVNEVKKRPLLYDKKHPDFKDRSKAEQEWMEIARILDTSDDTVKHRWKNLRASYCKFVHLSSTPDASKRKFSNFYLADKMSFLKEFVNHSQASTRKPATFSAKPTDITVADFSGYSVTVIDPSELEEGIEVVTQPKIFKLESNGPSSSSSIGSTVSRLPVTLSSQSTPLAYCSKSIETNQDQQGGEARDEVPAISHSFEGNKSAEKWSADLEFFKGLLPQVGELSRKRKRAFFAEVTQLLFRKLDEEEDESL